MLRKRLEAELLPLFEAFSGRVSLALYRFSDGLRFEHKAAQTMPAASLIKLPILVTALAEVDLGRLHLESRVMVEAGDMVGGSGVLHRLEPGVSLTLKDLLTLMIIVSDNTATNLVIDLVGREAVNYRAQALGLENTELVGGLQLSEAQWNERQRAGERNHTTAADILRLLVRLVRNELLSEHSTGVALAMLRAQQFTEALARYLPTDSELSERVTVASKSGCLRGVWHDAGVVYRGDEPWYALVAMTSESADRTFGWEQEGMMLMAHASRRVFDLLRKDPVSEEHKG